MEEEVYKKMVELAEEVEDIWGEKYRSRKKFDLIYEAISRYKNFFESEGIEVDFERVAIAASTLRNWRSWRRTFHGYTQFCLPSYGGYVWSLRFSVPFREFKKFLDSSTSVVRCWEW